MIERPQNFIQQILGSMKECWSDMATLETAQEKIDHICELLRGKALEPAREEASHLIEKASEEAARVIKEASDQAERLEKEAMRRIAQEKEAATVALQEAAKQSLLALREAIEKQLFAQTLHEMVVKGANGVDIVAEILRSLMKAVDREGTEARFDAVVSKSVSLEALQQALGEQILARLQNKAVEVGSIAAGALLKIRDKRITLDISDKAIEELLAQHLRRDFRIKLFGE